MIVSLEFGKKTSMKLATLKNKDRRDGDLIVVSSDNRRGTKANAIAPSLREAVENWAHCEPLLATLSHDLNSGRVKDSFVLEPSQLHSPFPRSFQWADGSAFLYHVKLVRMARGAEMPESFLKVPLMYQGGSDDFLAPTDPIPQLDFSHGTDFEGEVAVVVNDVPMGITPEKALNHIILFMIVNDVSLRGLIPEELAAGFGFFQSKPSSAFGPMAVTREELGEAWKGGRIHLPLSVDYNGERFGRADAGAMHFHFGDLIAHAARTRNLSAGTIIGSGTVSNEDTTKGSSCLAEKRMLEKINSGDIKTPFMKSGDTIKIEMLNSKGQNIFGTIEQKVISVSK